MPEAPNSEPKQDKRFHTYETHHIAWYVRAMWIGLWVGMFWYIIKYAIPSAKNYF